jgi:5-methyltetrahydropteroyltriglutamate--homocysteine methyltransferase
LNIVPQLIGYPRIGPNRELKWALEGIWSGRIGRPEFEAHIVALRHAHLAEQREIIGSSVDDFFLYDEALETALMLGIVPEQLAGQLSSDPFAVLSALARGTRESEAWEMTKWFDTNYHFVVPEVDRPVSDFRPLPWRVPIGAGGTWVVLGPYSLAMLSKPTHGLDREGVAASAGAALWRWAQAQSHQEPDFRLQLDEPSLGLVMDADSRRLFEAAYAGAAAEGAAAPLITVQFGAADEHTIEVLGRRGFAVQVRAAAIPELQSYGAWSEQPEHVVTVMDGRSVWPDDYAGAQQALGQLPDDGRTIRIVPSTSLMFLPYTVDGEDLPEGLQFAREKARSLAQWASGLPGDGPVSARPVATDWPDVEQLAPRAPRSERRVAQQDLALPRYPTTTIGSLPQTTAVRQLRLKLSRDEMDRRAYDAEIRRLITDAVRWQEKLALDVLVHGEFERTDMVEYFAQRMTGFQTTRQGWVASYGSRCVRPPILAAPPTISAPMTVDEWRIAQAATLKPVKGMLTGPITMVNWSFRPPDVADDRLFWAVAQPIAQEIDFLVEAGARLIQIDEPAVRERWPLATRDAEERRAIYARGVRAALSRVFNQPPHVQMHTHMCYGTDASIAPLWADAGVDVASIWYARSQDDERIQAFYSGVADGNLQIGPGLFDAHSPFSPGSDAMEERLRRFLGFMNPDDVWANPDCGLKTRSWDEVERQLVDMVEAARRRRNTGG